MTMSQRHVSVAVIGGGPGGYVAGIRAGQLGLDAVVIDPQPLGGTCLNVGCIPSKALIHAADEFAHASAQAQAPRYGISVDNPTIDLGATMAWKDQIVSRLNNGVGTLLDKAGVEVLPGWANVIDGKTIEVTLAAPSNGDVPDEPSMRITVDHLVLATGSQAIEIPSLPFNERVLSSTDVLALTAVPDRLAVVGGGYIGLELGTALAKLGTKVTVVEAEDRLLGMYDRALTEPVAKALAQLGVEVLLSSTARELGDAGLMVDTKSGPQLVPADKVLVTVGRRPATDGWGLDRLSLSMNGAFVSVDDRCQTSMRNVWAIGDLTGEPMLAHRAMKQGEVVAESIAGQPAVFDPVAIPAIVFTDPEIVTVGLSPDEAKAAGIDVVVGRFPFQANGRAMTLSAEPLSSADGMVRAVARSDDHLLVGLQAVGRGVAELATACGLALEMGARLEDVADTIHAHPTIGEALAEATLSALGHALHI